jgi:hypothetical protein
MHYCTEGCCCCGMPPHCPLLPHLRCCAATVSPTLRRHARHIPRIILALAERTFPCRGHPERTCAVSCRALGRLGQARVAFWPTGAASPWEPRHQAGFGPGIVPSFFYYLNLFSDLYIHRNSIILLKYIENELNLRKIQSKFCWNPLGWILAINLTQLHFVHYCLLENFYEPVFRVFLHKKLNLQTLHTCEHHII